MSKTLKELAGIVNGELVGDPGIVISGVSGIEEAKEGDLTFLANRRYLPLLNTTRASAVIVGRDVDAGAKAVIKTKDPSLAFAQAVSAMFPMPLHHPCGIHKTAVISKKAKIGKNVAVGPCAVIEDEVQIGENTIIYAGCFIGHGAQIGRDCLLYANVSVRERVVVGNRVHIQSGTVIGSEGFGYAQVEGAYRLIPQVGTVVIEDDVEIGANVTIDRARFDKTLIGKGTKIDNLVQIAHNVVIGQNCIIVAQAGISGSTHIGNNVTIAGQAGLVGHITIGDGATLAAQAGVTKSVPPNTVVSGYPARPHEEAKKIYACVQRLPELIQEIRELKKKIQALSGKE
ncbi:MAG: UDP-3-O-(3-hydroxymyristoyl)glucosamine N-acyltransferase [Candidatus Omnitrophota bacterium]